jgi:hypothetical protein
MRSSRDFLERAFLMFNFLPSSIMNYSTSLSGSIVHADSTLSLGSRDISSPDLISNAYFKIIFVLPSFLLRFLPLIDIA